MVTNRKNLTIGIVGGGQLGRMTILEARRMDIKVIVLTPEHPSPASDIADDYIVGDLYNSNKIQELANVCDILTYEIEHIDVKTLKQIEESGKQVYPSATVLETIQDKAVQKQVLRDNGLPVSDWNQVTKENCDDLLKKYGYPVVQKANKGGYDGKGVFVLKSEQDKRDMIQGESFFEEFVPFEKEIAVMVARNIHGQVAAYPVVEMEFDPDTNICDITVVPARIASDIQDKARDLAIKSVEALKGVGIFGVEMFLTKDGDILINELAPRPHNSGHYTIEGCITSQYEQYIRAIMDFPLGSTDLIKPNVMINLLGAPGYTGETDVHGYDEVLAMPATYMHMYGKRITKPNRKMGHITVLADDADTALNLAKKAKSLITIKSKEEG